MIVVGGVVVFARTLPRLVVVMGFLLWWNERAGGDVDDGGQYRRMRDDGDNDDGDRAGAGPSKLHRWKLLWVPEMEGGFRRW